MKGSEWLQEACQLDEATTNSFGTNMQITESLQHGMSCARLPAGDSAFNHVNTPPVDTPPADTPPADTVC